MGYFCSKYDRTNRLLWLRSLDIWSSHILFPGGIRHIHDDLLDTAVKVSSRNGAHPQSPTRCGQFGRLPPELRKQIWQHFLPRRNPTRHHLLDDLWLPYRDAPSNSLAILRVNKYLSHEILSQLYHKRELKILLDPKATRWVVMDTSAPPCSLRYTKFDRFMRLEIEILAPETVGDFGQVHQLDSSACELVCILCGRQSLLEIADRAYGSAEKLDWLHARLRFPDPSFSVSEPRSSDCPTGTSLPAIKLVWNKTAWDDTNAEYRDLNIVNAPGTLRFVLHAFQCLKNIGRSNMSFEVKTAMPNLRECCQRIFDEMLREENCQGSRLRARSEAWGPHPEIENDHILDNVRGYTANHLRLLRFQDWRAYKRSLNQLKLRISGINDEWRILIRTNVAFELRSVHRRLLQVCCRAQKSYREQLGLPKLGKRELWARCFPFGINASSSRYWLEHFDQYDKAVDYLGKRAAGHSPEYYLC